MFSMKKFSLILPALVLSLGLAGCGPLTASTDATTAPALTASESPATASGDQNTADVLNTLTVSAEAHADTYERDMFKHWVTENPTGCDTRYAVLEAEAVSGFTSNSCKVTGGTWVSEYDGETVTDASGLDIDHMVPLSEAWRSGASEWDAATRQAYANDLTNPNALVAVTANSNRSKSDQDPNNWMPDTDGCTYVSKWVNVKAEWKLTVDADEKDAILTVLSFCDDAPVEPAAPEAPVAPETPAAPEAPTAPVAPATPVEPAPADGTADQKFSSCKDATAAGFGPYVKGQDAEYDWYRDNDGDGTVCE